MDPDDTDNVMSSRVGKEIESNELEKEKWKKWVLIKCSYSFLPLENIFYLKEL
jgi:hypothetical protein